jgi:redox-sensitive bicupin YhaK (pirin superfamily)
MGPTSFASGKGVDVIPHPHINLATVTYLFEGQIVHRDSIGSVQTITPGAINLMVAGRGIVHSERSERQLREKGHRLNGIQLWCALPEAAEEVEPSFRHYPAEDLPRTSIDGARLRVMIGSAYGLDSPVETFSSTLYAEADLPAGCSLELPHGVEQLAAYLVSGELEVEKIRIPEHRAVLFVADTAGSLSARRDSRIALIGGSPLGRRHMWWNFVSSRKQRIEQAKADWKEGRFDMVAGEVEHTPLPEADGFSEINK